jgi:hypothetical protein
MFYEKVVKPYQRRPLVEYLGASYRVSERRSCKVLEIGRTTCRYESRQDWGDLRNSAGEYMGARPRGNGLPALLAFQDKVFGVCIFCCMLPTAFGGGN